jgi:hypothetical protein
VGATSTGAANTAAWFVIEDTKEEVVTAGEASLVVFLKRLFQADVKTRMLFCWPWSSVGVT